MTARTMRSIPLIVFLPLLGPAGCDPAPTESELPPLVGEISRFPVPIADSSPAESEGANPWVHGFGGAGPLQESQNDELAPRGSTSGEEPTGAEKPPKTDAMQPSEAPIEDSVDDLVEDEEPLTEAQQPLVRRFVRYLEGEGSDKLLGIWGESGTSPWPCAIQIYSNGGTSPWRSVPLPETFPETGDLVLCSLPEAHPECEHPLSGSLYNGNDALVIDCGGNIVDSFGRVGEDPGAAWTSSDGEVRSEGQDLVRCGQGFRADPLSSFAIGEDWISVQDGESPEVARHRCESSGAFGMGGAGGQSLEPK